DHELSLEKNVQRTIESSIWDWKKKADKQPLRDRKKVEVVEGAEFDPFLTAVDEASEKTSEAEKSERLKHQQVLITDCKAAIKDDEELSALFDAYENEFFKPAEVEELTGIPASRVYELKRKLVGKLDHIKRNHPSAEPAGF